MCLFLYFSTKSIYGDRRMCAGLWHGFLGSRTAARVTLLLAGFVSSSSFDQRCLYYQRIETHYCASSSRFSYYHHFKEARNFSTVRSIETVIGSWDISQNSTSLDLAIFSTCKPIVPILFSVNKTYYNWKTHGWWRRVKGKGQETDRGRDQLTALTIDSAHQLLQSFHFPLDPRLGESVVVLKNKKMRDTQA